MSTKAQAITHFNDGSKLYKINLFKEALEQYQKSLDNDPTFYDAHFCLAKTLIRLKEIEKGISHFSKYIHLMPEDKRGIYLLALSNILIDEKQNSQALKLVDELNVNFTENQTLDYVKLLLNNNKVDRAIYLLINFKNKNLITNEYKNILENSSIPVEVVKRLKNENIVPRFFNALKKGGALKTIEITDNKYKSKIEELISLISKVKEDKNIDYSKALETIELSILDIQKNALKQGGIALKNNNISLAKKILFVLETTKYDLEKITPFSNEIKGIEEKKKKKTIKTASLSIVALIVISSISYYSYSSYQKSQAYKRAITSHNLYDYNYYLSKYGDKEDIHKLREEKLYSIAVKENTSNAIRSLINKYPNSSKLKTVIFNSINNQNEFNVFGVNSPENRLNGYKNSKNTTFKIPIGCKIGYSLNEYNKLPVEKYLMVTTDLSINEKLHEYETTILEDNFINNHNKWNLINDVTNSKYYGEKINKKISIGNNRITLENANGSRDLVFSLIKVNGLNRSTDFEISADISTMQYKNHGVYFMFGGTNRAFFYFGYTGGASNGRYSIGKNNWDDSNVTWENWNSSWEYTENSNYDTNLTIRKENKKLYYYINGILVKEYPAKKFYGSKIGFGINGGTRTYISNLIVKKINHSKKIQFIKGNIYYCWVKELNVRDASSKGDIIKTIKIGDPVKYLGEVGRKKINATFKEQYKPDYYYKVELTDGTIGWVHGGALCEINISKEIQFSDFLRKDYIKPSEITKNNVSNETSDFYMIAIYAEKEKHQIEKRLNQIKNKGFNAGYLWIPDYKSLSGAKMYSAYVGPFSTKEECKNALVKVKKVFPKSYGILVSKTISERVLVK